MDSKYKKMARAGYVAKGSVYAITGVLTFMAAFNMGGQKTGKLQVIEFLEKQPFGNALLILIGLGLLCYAGWRFIQSISDPEGIGSDKKAKAKRAGFFVSGLIYLGLAVYAFIQLINAGSSSGGGGGQSSSFLAGQTGVYIFAIIGIVIAIVSFFQFKKAYTKEFLQKFNYKSISEEKRRKTIKNTGYLGLIARGIIMGILAFFFIRAAIESNTSDIKSTTDAFAFLQESSYGSYLLGAVAAGLVCYAIYVFMMAKYRQFQDGESE
ncbi:DUF1206 domain-containing protein [Salegentibacter sp. F188]|uniref:DUF1206 domain-containing protein n=1 Tax=Autumnicola patrickiae TaxID=3075591 RepID=A0ABU3E266_9FLAO|nr:DUF1206 domain-containing protein [Salegentibacter sp. F188]MDT0690086.1 DUF1206 domain-containing protein [Salegentibacter sp. F188]